MIVQNNETRDNGENGVTNDQQSSDVGWEPFRVTVTYVQASVSVVRVK